MITKEWIAQNCFTKSGGLNNRVTIKTWWTNRNLTSFLEYLEEAGIPIAERLYQIYTGITRGFCEKCGDQTAFNGFASGYRSYCSLECSGKCEKRAQKIKNSNDYDANRIKARATNLERYGTETPSKLFVHKSMKTKQERYGDPFYANHEKQRATIRDRYGVDAAPHIPSKIEKTKRVRDSKLPLLRDREQLIVLNKTHTLHEIAEMINVTPGAVFHWFRQHNIKPLKHYRHTRSRPQEEIFEFCKGLGVSPVYNDTTTIHPKDIDIYIPSHSVGIELNGVYWHKEKPKQHQVKMRLLKDKGIRCIQFWDHEWYEKQHICMSIIKSSLGLTTKLGARQCVVRGIDAATYREFTDANHLNGYAPASIRLGLFKGEQLVSVIGIGKSRFSRVAEYELVRACTLLNFTVVGGLAKLIKAADIGSLMTYCDLRTHTGVSYKNVGFEHLYDTKPNYFYWNHRTKQRISRLKAQKHLLPNLLDSFDPSLTEHQNMLAHSWYRVYDCGNGVWVYNK